MIPRRQLFAIYAWAALATIPCISRAQDSRQEQQHPTACSHEEFSALDHLAGDWTVSGSIRLPDGEWEEITGRARFSEDLDGCILIERYEDDRSAGAFSAIGLFSYDAIDGRLQKTWTDSQHGLTLLYRGGVVDGKMVFSASKEIRGTMHYFVEEYDFDGSDRFVHARRRATGDRNTWRATSRLVYERR